MESRARWEGARIPAGLLRLSVGLEDVDEIWADLEQALDSAYLTRDAGQAASNASGASCSAIFTSATRKSEAKRTPTR